MSPAGRTDVLAELVEAAAHVSPAPGLEPWDYGWCSKEYRRSAGAAISSPRGSVALDLVGVAALEVAVRALAREQAVRNRWDLEELWGLVASLVAAASEASDSHASVSRSLKTIRGAKSALTVLLVANVTWGESPATIGGIVVGTAGRAFLDHLEAAAEGRHALGGEAAERWLEEEGGTENR